VLSSGGPLVAWIPGPKQSPNKARRILAAAAVVYVALFILEARGTIAALFTPQRVTPANMWGPFVKGADCVGYYAWLRSPLISGGFHFDDEFAPTIARGPDSAAAFALTATGHLPNPWSVGPALAWAPAVITVHRALRGLGSSSPWPADGYSPPYQLAVGATTLALALLTLILAYRIGCRFAGPTAAAAAAALVTLGTSVVAYGAVEVSMAHGPATTALALFVFVWLRTFGSTHARRWVGLGCLLGLACLMRWQLLTFAVLPTLEAIWLATRADGWSARAGIAVRLAVAGLMCLVVFTPQLVAKQIVYGNPLGGLQAAAHNWLTPSFWAVLGSTDRSLFYWTPITLPGLVGLLYLAFRTRRPEVMILATAVAVQVYSMSALLGGDVFLGWSFGFRFLTETCVLMAPPIAVLLDRGDPQTVRRLAWGGGVLVGWNLLLLGVYRHCVGGAGGGDPAALLAMVGRYFVLRPLEASGMLAAASVLTFTLVAAFRDDLSQAADLCRVSTGNARGGRGV
jgi:hypothetical protein